jgi:hypothetical protein
VRKKENDGEKMWERGERKQELEAAKCAMRRER